MSRRSPSPARVRMHAQVLILLLGALFLGGGAGGSLSQRVERVVPEGPRRDAALVSVQRIEGATRESVREVVELRADLLRVIRDPEATSADLVDVLERGKRAMAEQDERLLDARFELRGHLTADEWRELAEGLVADGRRLIER